jgi:protein ImuB
MYWLAIHLPMFSLEVFARGDAARRPLAVSEVLRGARRIRVCNRAAVEGGVDAAMSVGAALAILPALSVLPRNEGTEQSALEGLALWAGQFTSQISLEPSAGLLLEVRGSLRLFGGMGVLSGRIQEGLEALGYQPMIAVAPTPAGAMLLARAGREGMARNRQELRSMISALPLQRLPLPLPPAHLRALLGMGLKRTGELLRLPREGLARRLGPEFIGYLERMLGEAPDPRPLFDPPARFRSRLELPAEVESTGALLFAARRLILELAGFLTARQAGTQTLEWLLDHGGGEGSRFRLGLASPERDAGRITELLRERLQRLELKAPVREIGLSVEQLQPLAHRPLALFAGSDAEGEEDGLLLERLRARLGEETVYGVRLVPDHRPERAWVRCRPGEKGEGLPAMGRPIWLLPEPVLLEERDGWPCRGGRLKLEPERERIEAGWWDGRDVARDYFTARGPEGGRLWIYRELKGERRWFLHGVFG